MFAQGCANANLDSWSIYGTIKVKNDMEKRFKHGLEYNTLYNYCECRGE